MAKVTILLWALAGSGEPTKIREEPTRVESLNLFLRPDITIVIGEGCQSWGEPTRDTENLPDLYYSI